MIDGLKRGDQRAYEEFVGKYSRRLYRFVFLTAGKNDAEDILQEIFMRVIKSIERYREEGKFETWLFRIADNACADYSRNRSVRKIVRNGIDPEIRDKRESPQEAAIGLDERERILAAVGELPEEQRKVFLLREEGGMSFNEIAKMLNVPLNTALGRMHYAMENLRKAMKPAMKE